LNPRKSSNPNSNGNNLNKADARFACGALNGAGPIRSIMKKSATDISFNMMQVQQNYSLKAENIDMYLNDSGCNDDEDEALVHYNPNSASLPCVQLNYQHYDDEIEEQTQYLPPQPQTRSRNKNCENFNSASKKFSSQVMQSDL
jgi:hypothetical protein